MCAPKIPSEVQTLHDLNRLLELATSFDLICHHEHHHGENILTTLKTRVETLLARTPHPSSCETWCDFPYDRFYHCLTNLHHNPLVYVDVGDQKQVNHNYIQVILIAQSCFKTAYLSSHAENTNESISF